MMSIHPKETASATPVTLISAATDQTPIGFIQKQQKGVYNGEQQNISRSRPLKKQTHVTWSGKIYLVEFANKNARKISAQLELILQEQNATDG